MGRTDRQTDGRTPNDCFMLKLAFHDADTDTDILARILADVSDTRD